MTRLSKGMGARRWVYARVGLCSMGGWRHLRRGVMPGDIVARDKDGKMLARHRHQFCDEHLSDTVTAVSSVPHETEVEVVTRYRWATPDYDPDGGNSSGSD